MTRTYDSGLTLPIRTTIRTGVIELLLPTKRTALNPLGFAVAVVAMPLKIRGRGDDDFEIDVLMEILNNRAPAYAVAVGDLKAKPQGMAPGQGRGQLDVDVYSFCNHNRHLVLGRLEPDVTSLAFDVRDPGIDAMLEVARALLFDKRITAAGTQAKELKFEEEVSLITGRDQSVWMQSFTIEVSTNHPQWPGVVDYLQQLVAVHRIGMELTTADPAVSLISTRTNLVGLLETATGLAPTGIPSGVATKWTATLSGTAGVVVRIFVTNNIGPPTITLRDGEYWNGAAWIVAALTVGIRINCEPALLTIIEIETAIAGSAMIAVAVADPFGATTYLDPTTIVGVEQLGTLA